MRSVENCPACATHSSGPALRLDSARRDRFIAFDERKFGGLLATWLPQMEVAVSICARCGHAWYRQQPSAAQLQEMYSTARPLFVGAGDISREPTGVMRQEMQRLRRVTRSAAQPTLLDYGSGFGRWARAAVHAGFAVTAFEPSHVRAAEEVTPFELVNSLEELRGRKFDAIQLEQVLEHVADPFTTLRSLHDYCHAGTLLRITVPNILRAPEGERLWDVWPYDGKVPHTLAPFEHLHGFTPLSLRTLCRRAGFRTDASVLMWRGYPANQVRRLVGAILPAFDTTQLLLRSTQS